jgi:sugar/nucleoside kinase (ribokinase family)
MAYGNAAASFILEARGSVTAIPTWEQVEGRAGDILSTLDR